METRSRQYKYESRRVNKNIYNRLGALIIPTFTVLTRRDIDVLSQQRITLEDDDVEDVSSIQLVDMAVEEVKAVFEQARTAGRISFADVRDKVMPVVLALGAHPSLNEIFQYLERHDEYLYKHSIGVSLLSRLIGSACGYAEERLDELVAAGFLHDIGKTRVPAEILNKPDKLTAEEFEQVKRHTVLGFDILAASPDLPAYIPTVALQHHEREDGSGYPLGLKGAEIDPYSKLIAVADVFHAMISRRVYKNPVPFYRVLEQMSQNAYGQLEPEITMRFLKRMMDLLIGNSVLLSNGHTGKIIMVTSHDPTHPLVEVDGRYIDLSKEHDLFLDQIM